MVETIKWWRNSTPPPGENHDLALAGTRNPDNLPRRGNDKKIQQLNKSAGSGDFHNDGRRQYWPGALKVSWA